MNGEAHEAKISYKLQAASLKPGNYKRFKKTYKKPACSLKLAACGSEGLPLRKKGCMFADYLFSP
jgi:hypothetical protein